MSSILELLRTLKLALKQLEAAGLQTGPDGDFVCQALRKQIEFWQIVEEREDDQVMYALVHRSRQKIHRSLAAHAMLPRFQPYHGAGRVNLLNASVH